MSMSMAYDQAHTCRTISRVGGVGLARRTGSRNGRIGVSMQEFFSNSFSVAESYSDFFLDV